MYEDFEKQINEVLENTRKRLQTGKDADSEKAKVFMYERLIDTLKKYVKKEALENIDFSNALSYYWKSATRMLKHVAENAKKMQVDGMAFCPDDEVYDWINEYYAKDDKSQVDAELKEAEERKRKLEADKAKEQFLIKTSKEKARIKLEATSEWSTLSDDEKKKKLNAESAEILKKLKAAERRKETAAKKKEEDTKPKAQEFKAPEQQASCNGTQKEDDEVLPWDEELPWEEEATVENESSAEDGPMRYSQPAANKDGAKSIKTSLKDLDGQISLFDLFTVQGVARC